MELENIYWSLFEGSGSVQAYLAYKELCATYRESEHNDAKYIDTNETNT